MLVVPTQICLRVRRIKREGITLDDNELLQMNESQIVAIETVFLNSEAPVRERVKFLGKHKRSSYVQEYMSGGSEGRHHIQKKTICSVVHLIWELSMLIKGNGFIAWHTSVKHGTTRFSDGGVVIVLGAD